MPQIQPLVHRFELTRTGAEALAARPVPPRRRSEYCVCGHKGKTHDNRGRCRAPQGCKCQRLAVATFDVPPIPLGEIFTNG